MEKDIAVMAGGNHAKVLLEIADLKI